jgi:hypothetical protein
MMTPPSSLTSVLQSRFGFDLETLVLCDTAAVPAASFIGMIPNVSADIFRAVARLGLLERR